MFLTLFLLAGSAAAGINEGFEADAVSWSAAATTGTVNLAASGENAFQGGKSLKIHYENLAGGECLRISPREPLVLSGLPLELNLRAYGNSESAQLLLTDAQGQVFTFPLGTVYQQWPLLQLDWSSIQGTGEIRLPLVFTELRFFPQDEAGVLYLDQLQSKEAILEFGQTAHPAGQPLKLGYQAKFESAAVSLPVQASLKRDGIVAAQRQAIISAAAPSGYFDFGEQRPGLYDCELTGQIANRTFSFPACQAVVLAPVQPAGSKPFLGVQTHYGLRRGKLPDNLNLVQLAGAEIIRDELFWREIEKKKGEYSFTQDYVGYVDEAVSRGLDILIILDYGNDIYVDEGGVPVTPEELAGWKGYVRAVVSRYKDKVKYWEVWNEFNIGSGFSDAQKQQYPTASAKVQLYLPLLRATYQTVKEIDPAATVIGGTLAGVDLNFIGAVISGGGLQYMDAISLHPYCYPQSPEGNNLLGRIAQVRSLMAQGGRQLPIWITEIGWPTHLGDGRGVAEATQAAYLARMYALFASQPDVAAVFWYDFQNDGTNPAYNEDNFGLVRQDFSPKPGYFSLSQICRALRGFRQVNAVSQGEVGLWHYQVVSSQGEKHILWSVSGTKTVALPINGTCLVRDLRGACHELSPPAALEVTASPVIVEAKGEAAPEESGFDFRFAANPLPQGDDLRIYLTATGRVRQATAELYNLAGRRVMQGQFQQLAPAVFIISTQGAEPGAYLVRVIAQFESGETEVERKLLLIL